MSRYLILSLLFFIPCVVFPFGTSFFETPKIIITEILIEVLFLLFLLKNKSFSFHIFQSNTFKILIGIIIVSVIHLLLYSQNTTFFGNVFRLQGIFMLWLMIVFSILSSSSKPEHFPSAFFLLSIAGLLITIPIFGTNETNRFIGSLGEPNALAASIIFLWPFPFFLSHHHDKYIKYIFPIIALLVIFLSNSRSGFLAFTIQNMFIYLSIHKRIQLSKSLTICALFLILSLILPFIEPNKIYENRAEIWETAWNAGTIQPVLGNGFGNIEKALYNTSWTFSNNVRYQYIDSSHNIFLDWWVQSGIIGALLLFSLLVFTSITFIKQKQKLQIVLLLGVTEVLLFNPASVTTLIAFWWIIGQGIRYRK